ncbi:MAG: hypothetical protein ACK44F_02075 [Roseococcus sp.]
MDSLPDIREELSHIGAARATNGRTTSASCTDTKSPHPLPLRADPGGETGGQEMMTMHRLAPFLTAAGLILILGVVVLMLTDGLTPGRVAPLAAALGAAGGGVLLVLGLAGLEHGRDRSREWG